MSGIGVHCNLYGIFIDFSVAVHLIPLVLIVGYYRFALTSHAETNEVVAEIRNDYLFDL